IPHPPPCGPDCTRMPESQRWRGTLTKFHDRSVCRYRRNQERNMNRRDFLSTSVAATAALATTAGTAIANQPAQKHQFQLAYAPHFGMFKENGGADPLDQLKYIADQGFTALEDNGMKGRPIEQQTAIAKEMERL